MGTQQQSEYQKPEPVQIIFSEIIEHGGFTIGTLRLDSPFDQPGTYEIQVIGNADAVNAFQNSKLLDLKFEAGVLPAEEAELGNTPDFWLSFWNERIISLQETINKTPTAQLANVYPFLAQLQNQLIQEVLQRIDPLTFDPQALDHFLKQLQDTNSAGLEKPEGADFYRVIRIGRIDEDFKPPYRFNFQIDPVLPAWGTDVWKPYGSPTYVTATAIIQAGSPLLKIVNLQKIAYGYPKAQGVLETTVSDVADQWQCIVTAGYQTATYIMAGDWYQVG